MFAVPEVNSSAVRENLSTQQAFCSLLYPQGHCSSARSAVRHLVTPARPVSAARFQSRFLSVHCFSAKHEIEKLVSNTIYFSVCLNPFKNVLYGVMGTELRDKDTPIRFHPGHFGGQLTKDKGRAWPPG